MNPNHLKGLKMAKVNMILRRLNLNRDKSLKTIKVKIQMQSVSKLKSLHHKQKIHLYKFQKMKSWQTVDRPKIHSLIN